MAKAFVSYILSDSDGIQNIHIVFDKYDKNSSKDATHEKWGKGGITYQIQPQGSIPKNWNLFLKSGENKASLAEWYSQYICDTLYPTLDNDQTIYISDGQEEKGMNVTNAVSVDVPALTSNMEEADGRIILHAVVLLTIVQTPL